MTVTDDPIVRALPGYEVGGELGRGGMGVVRAGRHLQLGRPVAIKELPGLLASDATVRSRFVAEARVLALLDHPHIVPIYDFVERDGVCLLVMEALPGGTIWAHFMEHGFTHEAACGVALVTCAALHYAHQHGVLHRDVKPENLLYAASGQVKVTDFGIAKVIGGNETLTTSGGEVIGSPAYIAPEQANGDELGPPADVYATGVMLYELLSGHLPYSEEGGAIALMYRHVYEDPIPLRSVAPNVDPRIAEVVMRAMARSPLDRYPSAEAFGVALAEAAGSVWGSGWLERGGTSMLASGPIAAAAARSIGAGPAPPPAMLPSPLVDGPAPPAAPPAPPASARHAETVAPGAVPPAPPAAPGDPAAGPPPPLYPPIGPTRPADLVRPHVATHMAGAQVADLEAEELVPVSTVLELPPVPWAHWLVASVLLLIVLVLAGVGLGAPSPSRLAGLRATVNGTDVSDGGSVAIDPGRPLVVVVGARPGPVAAAAQVKVQFSAAGIPLATTPAVPLAARPDGQAAATLDAGGGSYLLAGKMLAEIEFGAADGRDLGAHQFAATRAGSSLISIPGGVLVAGILMVVAYAEAGLRPLRRAGRWRVAALLRMALVGAGAGVLLAFAAWVTGRVELSIVALVACAVPGAAMGVAVALATARSGRRRRIKRAHRA